MVGCSTLEPNSSSKKAGSRIQPAFKPAGHGVYMMLNVDLAYM